MRTIELSREEYQILEMSLNASMRFKDSETKEEHLVLMKPDYKPVLIFKLQKS